MTFIAYRIATGQWTTADTADAARDKALALMACEADDLIVCGISPNSPTLHQVLREAVQAYLDTYGQRVE